MRRKAGQDHRIKSYTRQWSKNRESGTHWGNTVAIQCPASVFQHESVEENTRCEHNQVSAVSSAQPHSYSTYKSCTVSQDWSGLPGIQIFSVGDRPDHWNYPGYSLQDVGPVPEVITSPFSDLIKFPIGSAMQQGSKFNCHFAISFLSGGISGTFSSVFASRCHSYTMNAMAMVLTSVYILQLWSLGRAFSCLASGWQFGQPFWACFNHQMVLSILL